MEDVFRGFAFGGEVLDKGVDGSDGSDGGHGGCGGDSGFCVSDLLRVVISLGFPRHLRGSAFICAVSFPVASETKSFSNALGMISQGELLQGDGVNVHGIRIFGRM